MANKTLSFQLFGGALCHIEDQQVKLATRKVEALALYLACEHRIHQREHVASLFWGEMPQTRMMANLRFALSSLRKQLGPYLSVTRKTIGFAQDAALSLDVQRLLEQLPTAKQALTPPLAEQLEAALALYKGHFLEGFHLTDAERFWEWGDARREELWSQVCLQMKRLMRYQVEQEQHRRATSTAHRLLRLDPLQEEGHRVLMQSLSREGDRNGALAQFEKLATLLEEELGVAPEAETYDLLHQIRTAETMESHLPPAPTTPFIGRKEELSRLQDALKQDDCRLLTLIGPGGIGKTRLAYELAKWASEEPIFWHGVQMCQVEEAHTAQQLALLILSTLEHRSNDNPIEQLCAYLSDKEPLLVLDNFEHLLHTNAIDLVRKLLQEAPHLTLMVTSREKLGCSGEWLFPIGGLQHQSPTKNHQALSEAASNEALSLFLTFGQRTHSHRSLTPDEHKAALALCERLEGHPLALELAASWLTALRYQELVEELEEDLSLLYEDRPNRSARHQNMKHIFDHSWQQLTSQEQELVCHLHVCREGLTQEAIKQIIPTHLRSSLRRLLVSLVEKNWLKRREDGRFSFHGLLKEYALEKYQELPLSQQNAAAAHCQTFLQELSHPLHFLYSVESQKTLDLLQQDWNHIQEAWRWALANAPHSPLHKLEDEGQQQAQFERCDGLFVLSYERVGLYEGLQLLERWMGTIRPHISEPSAEHTASPVEQLWGAMQATRGIFFHYMGRMEDALETLQDSLQWLPANKLPARRALAQVFLASTLGQRWDNEGMARVLDEVDQLLSQCDAPMQQTYSMITRARVFSNQGDFNTSLRIQQRAITLAQNHRFHSLMMLVYGNMGLDALDLGQLEQAQLYMEKSLALRESVTHKSNVYGTWLSFAQVSIQQGAFTQAIHHLQEVLQHAKDFRQLHLHDEALLELTKAMYLTGKPAQAEHYLKELQALIVPDDPAITFEFELEQGILSHTRGDFLRAKASLTKAHQLAQDLPPIHRLIRAGSALANTCWELREYQQAQLHWSASLALCQEHELPWESPLSLCGLARWNAQHGHLSKAQTQLQEALKVSHIHGYKPVTLYALYQWCVLMLAKEQEDTEAPRQEEVRQWLQTIATHESTWSTTKQAAKQLLQEEPDETKHDVTPSLQEVLHSLFVAS